MLAATASQAQYNFGFEEYNDSGKLKLWNIRSGPREPLIVTDPEIKHSGNQSLSIERRPTDTATQFTARAVPIPVDFNGNKITISGWLKTEKVSAYAQLWLRQDDDKGRLLTLINYPRTSLKGTTEWTRYDTSFTLHEKASTIYFGFLIVGSGKVWCDDLDMLVDGVPIKDVARGNRVVAPALKDNSEFEKGSGIRLTQATPQQVENLALLGKVWGFLKYYHPFIAQGNLNWDYELFRFLPAYLGVKNKEERNALLMQWVKKLKGPSPCEKCSDNDLKNAIRLPDLDWLSDVNELGDSLSAALLYIRDNRHRGPGFYIDLVPGVGNPKILHEESYLDMKSPDGGYRLLSLFRYWNLVQYWFPYKHLIGEDWNNVLTEFIPKMLEADDKVKYFITTRRLIARIHDTHANTWGANSVRDSLQGRFYAPVKIHFVNDSAVVSKIIEPALAAASGLQTGDVILAINGKPVADIIQTSLPDLPASNRPTQLRDLAGLLLRSNDSLSVLTILRNDKQLTTTIVRGTRKQIPLKFYPDFDYQRDSSFFFIRPGIGYINLGTIKPDSVKFAFSALKDARGVIIDNRQYPGHFPASDIAEQLLPRQTPFVKFPSGNLNYPGSFIGYPPIPIGKKNPDYFKGKVIILVNEQTQSSAEYHTMAFQAAPGAMVLGSTTAGADGNVSAFYLPGGIYTMFSGIGVLYPDGRETQRTGIVPDVTVRRTIEGIRQGRDELVEKAAELINQN